MNERLRIDKNIVVETNTKGISKILFALRTEKGKDGKSPFEKHTNRKPNTPKMVRLNQLISENDPNLDLSTDVFSEHFDSTILVSERVRG